MDALKMINCFHCKSEIATFKNGWPLSTGSLAQLCDRCGSAYENGTFCKTFHVGKSGWSSCAICKMELHCGCIASEKDIFLMDFGGVCCMDCAEIYIFPQEEIALISANEYLKKDGQMVTQHGSQFKEQTHALRGNANSSSGIGSPADANGARSSGDLSASQNFHLMDLHKMKGEENLKAVLGIPNATITRLFSKFLTPTDTRVKNGRLVIPKKHAEAFFPKLTDTPVIPFEMYDTDGKIWKVNYRYWTNCKGRMYVLEELSNYIEKSNWQVGDEVGFYRIEPMGGFLIVTEKLSHFAQRG